MSDAVLKHPAPGWQTVNRELRVASRRLAPAQQHLVVELRAAAAGDTAPRGGALAHSARRDHHCRHAVGALQQRAVKENARFAVQHRLHRQHHQGVAHPGEFIVFARIGHHQMDAAAIAPDLISGASLDPTGFTPRPVRVAGRKNHRLRLAEVVAARLRRHAEQLRQPGQHPVGRLSGGAQHQPGPVAGDQFQYLLHAVSIKKPIASIFSFGSNRRIHFPPTGRVISSHCLREWY